MLTGKSKEDFEYFCLKQYDVVVLGYEYTDWGEVPTSIYDYLIEETLPTFIVQSMIIEWFKSLNMWENHFYHNYRSTEFKDYNKAVEKSIEVLNDVYNATIEEE